MVYSCSYHNHHHSARYGAVLTVLHPWVSCMQCQKRMYPYTKAYDTIHVTHCVFSNTTLAATTTTTSRSIPTMNGASHPSKKTPAIDFADLMQHLKTLQFKHEAYRNQCKEQRETN